MARLGISVLAVLVLGLGLVPGVFTAPAALAVGGPMRGCGGGQQNVAAPAISELPRVNVSIYDGFFLPAEISVAPGTVVVWRNMGSQPHTTTAWGRWDSGILGAGDACAAWFVTPGSYAYLSIVAADGGVLQGTVTVEGAPIGGGAPAMAPMPGVGPGGMMPGMGPGGMMPGMGPGGMMPGMGPGGATPTAPYSGAGN